MGKIEDLKKSITPLSKTESNQLKGGFSQLKTKPVCFVASSADNNVNCYNSVALLDDTNRNCHTQGCECNSKIN